MAILPGIPLLADVASKVAVRSGLTERDLAFYLNPNLLDLVRPGWEVKWCTSEFGA